MEKTEQGYALAFESSPLPMWVIDRETMAILVANDAALRQYGYGREEFLSLSLRDLRPPDALPELHRAWERYTRESSRRRPVHIGLMKHCRKDGTLMMVDVTASPIQFEGREALLSVAVDATDRVRAEDEARRSRERFEYIGRAVDETIWDLNLVTGEVWRSGGRGAVFGRGPDQVAPRLQGWSDLLHPADHERVVESLQRAIESGEKTWASEYRLRQPDGTWADMLDRGFVIHDEKGHPVRVVGSMVDITERRRLDQELQDQRTRLKAIFDNAQDAIFLTNEEYRFVDANPAACELFGYTRDEILSLVIWDLVPGGQVDETLDRMRRIAATGRLFGEGQGRRKDGSIVEVEYRSVANIEPGVHLTVIRDIGARKRADRILMDQKQRLQALFDYAQDAILLENDEGRYIDVNPAACALFGYTREELCSRSFLDLVLPEERPAERARFHRMLESGRSSGEAKRVRKDGSLLAVEFRTVANIEPGVHLAVVRDITTRRRNEESLRSLSGRLLRLQDEERRRLARELHDSTAQSLAALALELAVLDEGKAVLKARGRQALAEAERLADQCSRELRTLAYLLHPPLLDEMGLSAALRGYVDGFSKRSGIEVTLDVPSEEFRLSSETETALFRIVQECLTNVHRHSSSPVARVRLALEPHAVLLEVSDRGQGLQPGGANEPHDLGVGIAGMKERVRQLGGLLELESSSGGVTVRASLPRS